MDLDEQHVTTQAQRYEAVRCLELGRYYAERLEYDKAMDFFTKSIGAVENYVAYAERADLHTARIRHHEAALDFMRAKRLANILGDDLDADVDARFKKSLKLTKFYHNGMRDRLLEDYEENSVDEVALKIGESALGVGVAWIVGNKRPLFEYLFFNEIESILTYEDMSKFPEVEDYLSLYKLSYIKHKASECPDIEVFNQMETNLHAYLCCYDVEDSRYLRRNILWSLHQNFLEQDYGDIYSMSSDAKETISEARAPR